MEMSRTRAPSGSRGRVFAPFAGLLAAGLLLWIVGGAVAQEASAADDTSAGTVMRIRIDSVIHPIAAEHLTDALARAEEANARALVVELNTPGGLLTSTREMTTAMLASPVPVVIWVAPSGAQAASAGFFLLMAADVAAMAPSTNTGAAHPVGGAGEEIEGVMADKVEQDAAATIRSLAARNGRDEALAEAAVMESRSFTDKEALEAGLIDLIAADLPTLLERIDGREIGSEGDEPRVLATSGAVIESVEMSAVQRFLSALAHPNIAYLLMTLGGLGLYFELSNPGAVLPGVVGAVCLILAFFALSVLPINYAGVALILLALIFFIAEVKVTSYGLLTVAGLVSLVLGSLMLFKGKNIDPAIRVSFEVIATVVVVSLVVVVFLMSLVIKAHRRQVSTGREGLIHAAGEARSALTPEGLVFVHGEIWSAVAEGEVAAGQPIEVLGVEGMKLRVRGTGAGSGAHKEEV
jgi:membrane-bound serine protease (ClpP class)